MSRVRLRGRLAASHALLALLLVAIAGVGLRSQSQRVRTADARTGAREDAEVLAARIARIGANDPAQLAALVDDESTSGRRVAIVGTDGTRIAGTDIEPVSVVTPLVMAAIRQGRTSVIDVRSGVVAIVPASVGQSAGAAVLAEPNPGGGLAFPPWGIDVAVVLATVAAAAAAGWFLAGRISRPIEGLTDSAHRLALGRDAALPPTSAAVPEVATLSAALSLVADRVHRLSSDEEERVSRSRRLLRRISHQMRTPLTVMRLRLDDVCDDGLPSDRRVLLADVFERQIDSLDDLAEQMKAETLLDTDTDLVPVDLAAAVRGVVERLAPLARWSGLDLRVMPSRPAIVAADRSLLDDAVANVVENAIKFTPRGGNIRVGIDVQENEAILAVADSGPGIKPDERELVVRPSVRGSAGAVAAGTGVGLSLVADALDRMGGRLELDDRPGGGAVVRLVLRLA